MPAKLEAQGRVGIESSWAYAAFFFFSCSTSLLLRVGREGSDPSTLFRGLGEKQYLWQILQRENPWGIANVKQRNDTWDRAAEKVMKPGYIEIPENNGRRTVKVDVCRGAVRLGRACGDNNYYTVVGHWCIPNSVLSSFTVVGLQGGNTSNA